MTRGVTYALVPAVSALLAYLLSPLAARVAVLWGAVDMPNERKIHRQPMPRLGGLAILGAVALVLGTVEWTGFFGLAVPQPLLIGLVLGLLPVVAVSLVDDIKPVPARVKFACHVAGAVAAITAGVSLPPQIHLLGRQFSIGFFAVPVSVLWIAGVTNAFNIIDGLDGLAAGLGLIAALAMSGVFLVVGQFPSALVPLALAGALAGFLPYNLYPARMFLGDTGATAVGFCLAAVALKGGSTVSAGFAAALPILLMGLPIADTLIAISRRLVRKAERSAGGIFQADSNHIHHRLLALGIDHRKAVLILYGLGALLSVVAFISLFVSSRESALLLLTLTTGGFIGVKRLGYDEFALLRRGTILRLYDAPVLRRALFVPFVDMAIVAASVYLAIGLKTDDWLLLHNRALAFEMTLMLAPLSGFVFWKARLYQGSWKLATIDDYTRAAVACTIAVAFALGLLSWQWQLFPASLTVVYGLVSTVLIVGTRASYRVLVSARQRTGRQGTPVLLYGPGPEDLMAARDLIDRAIASGFRPVGLINATRAYRGRLVDGIKVWGTLDELPQIVRNAAAQGVLIGEHSMPGEALARLSEFCATARLGLFRLHVEVESIVGGIAAEATPGEMVAHVGPRAGFVCPSCGSAAVRRSRAKGVELARRKLTTKRLFRCEACRWRGWRQPLDRPLGLVEQVSVPPNLAALDDLSRRRPLPSRTSSDLWLERVGVTGCVKD